MTTITQIVQRKHPAALCEECPLYSRPCAPTISPLRPQAAIVSRSPGYHEGIAGKPFSGPSGKVLDHLLKMNGVTRNDVLVTNTVLCAPDDAVVPPEAIKACAPRLDAELAGIPLVLACGSEAVGLLIGRGTIDRHRGQRITQPNGEQERVLVATNNPALVLRDDSVFPNLRKDFKRAFNPLPAPRLPETLVIEEIDDACRYIEERSRDGAGAIAADIESRGGLSHRASLVSIQFATEGTHAVVLGERRGLFESRHFLDDYLRPFLESRHLTFIWHGGKFDTKILRHTYGINARVDQDTMLLSYALDERSGTDERIGVHGLDYLLMEELGWPYYSSPSVEKAKKTGIVEDYDEFYHYAGLDVGGTFQLFQHLQEQAKKDNVLDLNDYLIEANDFLTDVELHGMVYDVQAAADLYEFVVLPELEELIMEMRKQIDLPLLNPRAPGQIAAILYDTWGIKHAMQNRPKTPTMRNPARSVDDSARREIIANRFTFRGMYTSVRKGNTVEQVKAEGYEKKMDYYVEFVNKYHRFQKLQKQASTYILGMIERAEQDEAHRIYTSLNLHGTNSGRLSSSRPNLQNITRAKEDLPAIRSLFRAPNGSLLVQADFSQAELRCIAARSGDKELTRIYANGLDLHNETARRFYGEDFTKEQRQTCKNVNFGVFYRQGAETFQEKHNIDARRAQEYIDWVWQTFTGVGEWEVGIEQEIRKRGVLVSPFGRKRRFHLLTRENIQAAFREGINFDPQSTASDLTLSAAIKLNGLIDRTRAAIVLLVHDSILAEVKEDYVAEYSDITKEVMESIALDKIGWTLPFAVDVGHGVTWGDC